MAGPFKFITVRGADKTALHRSLGAMFGIAVAVGSMVGVGVLRTPGIILGHLHQPLWALLVWIAGAAYVMLCVNYMAELASAIPRSGGVYVFAERTLGGVGGTVVGWSDFLNSVFAIALLAVALAEYIGELVAPLHDSTALLAALLIAALTALNLHGVRTASGTQQLTSLVKLLALWALAAACLMLAHPAWGHLSTLAAAPSALVSGAGIIASFQLVLGAFNGWAAPAYFGGEAVDTRHGVARSLVYGALLVSATYIAINAAILYVVPPAELMNSKLPAAAALERLTSTHGLHAGIGGTLFVAVAVLSLPSTLQAVMMQTSRTLHAMSEDGLFLRWGSRVNRRGSPANATLVCGIVAIPLALTSSFETLFITFTVFAVLNNLILLCGVVRLRRLEPNLARPFRMLGYPWALIPIVMVDLVVFYGFASANLRQCLLSAASVIVLYFAYRLRRRRRDSTGHTRDDAQGGG
jgi:basic amino acid/polyamine antiporter, APA family